MEQIKKSRKLVGRFIKQPKGYTSFIPEKFPSKEILQFDMRILRKSEEARAKMSYLNGIAHHIPDVDFFIFMFLNKDATASSKIEGTNAEFEDVLESNVQPSSYLPDDVEDMLYYIRGLNSGLNELKKLPLSERLIKLIHFTLMSGARTNIPGNTPGEFRTSQNWIGGRNISDAHFIPPPHTEVSKTIGDLEKFIHSKNLLLSPVIQAALVHAQFETIHPFLDGNGRTGRMLVTLFFAEKKIMEKPLLYLSHYFRKHRDVYYERLFHYSKGEVDAWVDFFLDAVIEIAEDSIKTIERLSDLRDMDREKIVQIDKRSSENVLKILNYLYQVPITTNLDLQKKTGLNRNKVQTAIKRMIVLNILSPRKKKSRSQMYEYKRYIEIFTD